MADGIQHGQWVAAVEIVSLNAFNLLLEKWLLAYYCRPLRPMACRRCLAGGLVIHNNISSSTTIDYFTCQRSIHCSTYPRRDPVSAYRPKSSP